MNYLKRFLLILGVIILSYILFPDFNDRDINEFHFRNIKDLEVLIDSKLKSDSSITVHFNKNDELFSVNYSEYGRMNIFDSIHNNLLKDVKTLNLSELISNKGENKCEYYLFNPNDFDDRSYLMYLEKPCEKIEFDEYRGDFEYLIERGKKSEKVTPYCIKITENWYELYLNTTF